MFGFTVRKRRFVRRRPQSARSRAHYIAHRELARERIMMRLHFWNSLYTLEFGTVSIRNQSSRWGSCSAKKNLNFNYRIAFLPEELLDYVIVHELCHLIEFNHSSKFWEHVARTLPDYHERRKVLQKLPMHTPKVEQNNVSAI